MLENKKQIVNYFNFENDDVSEFYNINIKLNDKYEEYNGNMFINKKYDNEKIDILLGYLKNTKNEERFFIIGKKNKKLTKLFLYRIDSNFTKNIMLDIETKDNKDLVNNICFFDETKNKKIFESSNYDKNNIEISINKHNYNNEIKKAITKRKVLNSYIDLKNNK